MRTKEYIEMDGLNAGLISAFMKSPEDAELYLNQPDNSDKPEYVIGNITEMLVYSKGDLDCLDDYCVIVPDDMKLNEGEGYKINKKSKEDGLVVVKRKILLNCLQMAENVLNLPLYDYDPVTESLSDMPYGCLKDIEFEHSTGFQFEIGGILCKAEIDIVVPLTPFRIIDLKTTGRDMNRFYYPVKDYKYWNQKCHYDTGFKEKFKEKVSMSFLVVSSKPPFLARQFFVNDDMMSSVTMEEVYLDALVRCDEWLKAGKPVKGYIDQPANISINADYLLRDMHRYEAE